MHEQKRFIKYVNFQNFLFQLQTFINPQVKIQWIIYTEIFNDAFQFEFVASGVAAATGKVASGFHLPLAA